MTTPRVRVWSRDDNGRRVWRWCCPVCRGGTTKLCHSHATALNGALRHLAQAHAYIGSRR